jgi:hypothetical protein
MKAKKLELREEGKTTDGKKRYYLYVNGVAAYHRGFEYNEKTKLIESSYVLEKEDGEDILSFLFSDLPDNILLGDLSDNKVETKTTCFNSISIKGEELISYYYINIDHDDKSFIWNPELFIIEMKTILIEKGFAFDNEIATPSFFDDSVLGNCSFKHANTKGTLLEIVSEAIELINQAEKETHARMLKLAIAEGKRK